MTMHTPPSTLAPWTYQSSELLQLEKNTLFKPSWQFVGHICDLKNVGDFLTFHGFDERVVVVRDGEGKINAFHNICRHRGAPVIAESSGNCRYAMSCPFHGWTYGLDGKLQGVPSASTFKNLDKSGIALEAVDVEIWMGLIFVRIQPGGDSLEDQMRPIEEELLPYRLDQVDALFPGSDELKPYNWKIIHDIDNEGYHVPIGHPSLQQLYGANYLDTIENGFSVSRGRFNKKIGSSWSVKNYRKLLPKFDHLDDDRQGMWMYVLLFPNLVLGLYPDMMEIYMTIPVSVNQTRYISRTFALPDSRPEVRAARFLNVRINNETSEEDDKFVSWLQEGMKSSAWQPPILSNDLEQGVLSFHQAIKRLIPVAHLPHSPDEDLADLNARELAKNGNPTVSVRIR